MFPVFSQASISGIRSPNCCPQAFPHPHAIVNKSAAAMTHHVGPCAGSGSAYDACCNLLHTGSPGTSAAPEAVIRALIPVFPLETITFAASAPSTERASHRSPALRPADASHAMPYEQCHVFYTLQPGRCRQAPARQTAIDGVEAKLRVAGTVRAPCCRSGAQGRGFLRMSRAWGSTW